MKQNQYKLGAALSYVSIFLTNIIGLFLTPFIMRRLGDSEYGLYALIGSFIAYLALMDLGLNNTIVRFVSKYKAEGKDRNERLFLGDVFIIYGLISGLAILVGMILYIYLDAIFKDSLSMDQVGRAKIMYLILMVNVAVSLPGGAFTAICNAYERFVFPRAFNIVRYLVRAVVIVGILMVEGGAVALVMIDTIINILGIFIMMIYCFRYLKIRIVFQAPDLKRYRPIFNYSLWIFVIAITHAFQWRSGQVVLGINANTVQVAIFAVGVMLGTYYGAFAGAINTLLLPKASQMIVKGESSADLTNMVIRVGRICGALSLLILSGFIVFGKEFIYLWVGKVYEESWLVSVLIMIGTTIPLTQMFGNSILEARDKVKHKALANFITILLGVILGFFVSKNFGIKGMIVPLVCAMFVNVIITNFLFVKTFGFDYVRFYNKVYARQLLVTVFIVILALKLKKYFILNSWISLGFGTIVYGIIFALIFFYVIFNNEEKKRMRLI